MKKPQKYPDLSRVRIAYWNSTVDAIVIFKNVSRYAVAIMEDKLIVHLTENQITEAIEKAVVLESPLTKALNEREI